LWETARKKKGAKKKESRSLWKLPELWKNKKQFFHTSLQNAAAFRPVPTGSAAGNPQTTKPDRSLATKTGHFH